MKKNTKIHSVLQTAFCQHCTTVTYNTTISSKQYCILASVERNFSSLPPSPIHPSSLPFFCCYCCSVAKLCPTRCDPMDCRTPGFPFLHYLLEFAQTRVPWVGDSIQLSHPLLPPSPAASIFPSIRVFSSWGEYIFCLLPKQVIDSRSQWYDLS